MLFTCLPAGAQIPGRFPGPVHARGKWFTIDIHCHVAAPKAEEMVRGPAEAGSRAINSPTSTQRGSTASRPSARESSSPRSRSASPTWTGWGSTSRRSRRRRARPITAPTPIWGSPPRGSSTTTSPTSARAIPTASSGSARCRSRRPSWRSPNSNGCTNRWGCAASRSPPTSPARICRSRASARSSRAPRSSASPSSCTRPAFPRRSRFRDHYLTNVIGNPLDTTVAVHHLIFGGVLARPPQSEARAVAWRRLSAGLFRADRPRRLGAAGHLRASAPHADDVSEAALFRHDRLHPSPARIPGRPIRRRPRADGHRLSGRHGRNRPDRVRRGRRRASTMPSAARSSAATPRAS